MPLRLFAAVVAVVVLAPLAAAQEVSQQLDAHLSALTEFGQFSGTVLVADGGEVIYEKGFGEADRTWDVANTPETRFRIASLTKQFTAALVLQLVEDGRLDLDVPIATYLPDYPSAQADAVTLHHLLSHTGGVPEHTSRPDMSEIMRRAYTPDAFLALFADEPLDFEPGTAYRYSNSGYYLLGVIVEAVTGEPFADVLTDRLLAPLGLDATAYDPFPEIVPQMAHGYQRAGLDLVNAPYIDPSVPYAAGMMVSTARDLYTWTEALHGGEVFREMETYERMTTPVLSGYGYGLGIAERPIGGQAVRTIAHSGGIPGFSTFLIHFPDQDRTVVVLDNTQGNASEVARSLGGILYGQPAAAPRQPVGRAVGARIAADGIDAAVAFYRSLARDASDYDMGEDELNALGYTYLRRGDVATAVRVFELNVEAYPEASNPYDSLGEAYLAAGDTARAVANYERSLALNPGNQNARDVLADLGADTAGETVELAEATLERYVGDYAVQPSFVITVTREGSQLYAQATGQPQFEIYPSSETRFYLTVVDAQVTFVVEGDGPATSLILHQGGRDTPAERVE